MTSQVLGRHRRNTFNVFSPRCRAFGGNGAVLLAGILLMARPLVAIASEGARLVKAEHGEFYAATATNTCRLGGGRGALVVPQFGPAEIRLAGAKPVPFDFPRVPYERRTFVTSTYCAWTDGSIIVSFTEETGDGTTGRVARIEAATGRTIWAVTTGGNVGEPLVTSGAVYYTASWRIGKADLRTGKVLWEHLQQSYVFEYFQVPSLLDGQVVFVAAYPDYLSLAERTVKVDDKTGRMVQRGKW